jgi:prophage regulatory protein
MNKESTNVENNRLLRLRDVLVVIPIAKSTWYEGIAAGHFPKPVKLGVRAALWREKDILDLIEHGAARSFR